MTHGNVNDTDVSDWSTASGWDVSDGPHGRVEFHLDRVGIGKHDGRAGARPSREGVQRTVRPHPVFC